VRTINYVKNKKKSLALLGFLWTDETAKSS
jgi:hypothetical protein